MRLDGSFWMGVHDIVLCTGFHIIGLAFWWSGIPDHRQRINNMGHVHHASMCEFFVSHIINRIMLIHSVSHMSKCLTYPIAYSFSISCLTHSSVSHNHVYPFSVTCPSANHHKPITQCVGVNLFGVTWPSASHIQAPTQSRLFVRCLWLSHMIMAIHSMSHMIMAIHSMSHMIMAIHPVSHISNASHIHVSHLSMCLFIQCIMNPRAPHIQVPSVGSMRDTRPPNRTFPT